MHALQTTLSCHSWVSTRLVSCLLSCVLCVRAVAQTIPSDWRSLQEADTPNSEWFNTAMTHVEADFNGDGKIDHARMLLHKRTNGVGLFVFLDDVNGPEKTVKLEEHPPEKGEFMLSLVREGCYKSERQVVCLKDPGLKYSEIEYGFGSLYWFESGKWHHAEFYQGEFDGLLQ